LRSSGVRKLSIEARRLSMLLSERIQQAGCWRISSSVQVPVAAAVWFLA
jgi:hypothetical protein